MRDKYARELAERVNRLLDDPSNQNKQADVSGAAYTFLASVDDTDASMADVMMVKEISSWLNVGVGSPWRMKMAFLMNAILKGESLVTVEIPRI